MSGGDWKDMYSAARRGDLELVRFHVAQGVDVDYAHPEFQSTALVASILAGHEEIAHLLLDSGADPLLRSEFDELTPMEAAHREHLTSVQERLSSLGAPAPADVPRPRRSWWRRSGR